MQVGSEKERRTYHTEVTRSDEADGTLARVWVVSDIPHFNGLVCASRREASADVRVHVERRHSTVMGRKREARRRRGAQVRGECTSIKIEH